MVCLNYVKNLVSVVLLCFIVMCMCLILVVVLCDFVNVDGFMVLMSFMLVGMVLSVLNVMWCGLISSVVLFGSVVSDVCVVL